MPRFAANLWYLFQEVDLMDRFGAAAKAGFKAVEIQFPYQWRGADLAARLDAFGLRIVLINAPPATGRPVNGGSRHCRGANRNSAIPSAKPSTMGGP